MECEHGSEVLLGAAVQAASVNCGIGVSLDRLLDVTMALYGRLIHPATALSTTLSVARNGHQSYYRQQDSRGGPFMADMTVDDTATLTVSTTDDHGDPTSDQVSFSPDDNGAVVSLAVNGNTATATPVAEGTVNITVSDPAAPGVAPQVVTLNVGAGPTSQVSVDVQVNAGANQAQPPAGP